MAGDLLALACFDCFIEVHIGPFERAAVTFDHGLGPVIIFFTVPQENVHCFYGHRAIDVDGDLRNQPFVHQAPQNEQQLLRTLDGKRRYHNGAALLRRISDNFGKPRARVIFRMKAVAISCFHDQVIYAVGNGVRLPSRSSKPAQIAGEENAQAIDDHVNGL